MTKLIMAFRKIANAPKIWNGWSKTKLTYGSLLRSRRSALDCSPILEGEGEEEEDYDDYDDDDFQNFVLELKFLQVNIM